MGEKAECPAPDASQRTTSQRPTSLGYTPAGPGLGANLLASDGEYSQPAGVPPTEMRQEHARGSRYLDRKQADGPVWSLRAAKARGVTQESRSCAMRAMPESWNQNVWRISCTSRHRPGDGPGRAVVGGAVVGGAVVGGAVVGGAVVGGAVVREGGVVVVAVCGAVPLLQAPRTSETAINPKSKYRRIRTSNLRPCTSMSCGGFRERIGRGRGPLVASCRRTGDGSHILTRCLPGGGHVWVKRRANASSSTTLPSRPLNRFAMTEMTPPPPACRARGIRATASVPRFGSGRRQTGRALIARSLVPSCQGGTRLCHGDRRLCSSFLRMASASMPGHYRSYQRLGRMGVMSGVISPQCTGTRCQSPDVTSSE